jgi:hypothetical protein
MRIVGPSASAGKKSAHRYKFTSDEDRMIRTLVERFGDHAWEHTAEALPLHSPSSCRDRYQNYLLDSLITAPWTPQEDAILFREFQRLGPKWAEIGKMLPGRSKAHVKNRWNRHLWRLDAAFATPQLVADDPPREGPPAETENPPEPGPKLDFPRLLPTHPYFL